MGGARRSNLAFASTPEDVARALIKQLTDRSFVQSAPSVLPKRDQQETTTQQG
jgi:hypothetical protein